MVLKLEIMNNANTVGNVMLITDFIFGKSAPNKNPSATKKSCTKKSEQLSKRKDFNVKVLGEINFAATVLTDTKKILVVSMTVTAAKNFSVSKRERPTGLLSRKSAVLPETSLEIIDVPTFIA